MRRAFVVLAVGMMRAASFSGCLSELRGEGAADEGIPGYAWKDVLSFVSGFRETDRINADAAKIENLNFKIPENSKWLEVTVKVEFEKDFVDGYLSPVTGAYSALGGLEPTSNMVLCRGSANLSVFDPSGKISGSAEFDNIDPAAIVNSTAQMTFPRVLSEIINISDPQNGNWSSLISTKGVGHYKIRAAAYCPASESEYLEIPCDAYLDKIRGSFVGQMAGVTYAYPYEFRSKEIIELPLWPWIPPIIVSALNQDDIYVEMTFLESMVKYGINVSQEQAAIDFSNSQYDLWHANYYARENLRNGIMPPYSGHPKYNEHADDIDFQIEADLFGLISPGLPAALWDFCDRFGHIMNYGDGIYGGLFITSMYCKAFFESDPVKIVEHGLSCLPAGSYYAQTISDVLGCYYNDPEDWRAAWEAATAWDSWDHCPDKMGIPANVNGAYAAIGLLFGDGDIWKTMEIATRCGRDADCNPASACGVLGAIMGYGRLPDDMKACLPMMDDQVFSYTNYTWITATETMYDVGLQVIRSQGGKVEGGMIYVPVQDAPELELERWDHGLEHYEVPLEFATSYPPCK